MRTISLALGAGCLAGCYLSHAPPEDPAPAAQDGVCRLPAPLAEPPIDALCAFARGGRSDHPMPFVVGVEDVVVGIDATGTPVELHRFEYAGADPEHTHTRAQVIAVRGDYAAVGIEWITEHESDVERVDGTLTVALVLLDLRARTVLHRLGWQTPWSNRGGRFAITGSANGLFVFDVHDGPTEASSRFGVLSPDGSAMLAVEGLQLLTDPSDSGVVGVIDRSDPERSEPAWLDLCTLARRPMRVQSPSARGGRVFGRLSDAFEHPLRLAWESPEETGPSMDIEPRSTLQAARGTSGRLLVDVEGDPSDFRLYDTERGTFEAFRVRVPPGLRRLPASEEGSAYFHNYLGSTSDGSILLGMRDDRSASLYRSRDGQSWSPVGEPVGLVGSVSGWEVAGTLFVFGSLALDVGEWQEGDPTRLDGNSVQVVREASGLHMLLRHDPPGTAGSTRHRVSEDGRCMAVGGQTHIGFIELDGGNRVDVDLSAFGEVGFPLRAAWTWAMPSIERRM